jgi:putative Holliday junction resolvase
LTVLSVDGRFLRVRVLGLDVGSKTIGVAVTDELGVCAHSVATIARKGTRADVPAVLQLAAKYGATLAVAGMPYELDGTEGPRAQRVRVFLDALVAGGLPVELWDERFSTVEAERVLLQADLSRAKRKKVIDALAAQVILQGWLDSRTEGAA